MEFKERVKLIEKIQIKNWKRHTEYEVGFTDGVNFIIGPNGIGKTAILEAICLAFAGKSLTVDDPKQLVNISSDDPAQINVILSNNGRRYNIERRISKRSRGSSKMWLLGEDEELLATGWDDVTRQIEELFEIKNMFFERIIYMPEGDIFRFIESRSKQALMDQLEDVLGVNRMENILGKVGNMRKTFQTEVSEYKTKKKQAEGYIRKYSDDLPELKVSRKTLDNEKRKLEKQLGDINERLGKLSEKTRNKKQIKKEYLDIGDIQDIGEKIELYGAQFQELTNIIKEKRSEIDQRMGQIESLKKVLDLIVEVEGQKDADIKIRCPVCQKPLSFEEIPHIRNETKSKINDLESEMDNIDSHLKTHESELEDVEKGLEAHKQKRERAGIILKDYKNAENVLDAIQTELDQLESEAKELDKERQHIKAVLTESEKGWKKVTEKMIKIERMADDIDIKDLDTSIIAATKGEMISSILEKAIKSTVKVQRDRMLEGVYQEISATWSEFMKSEELNVELDDSGTPKITKRDEEYIFQQLSGGEKTALLIITHTILSKYFADVGFMLLDEPLEHLDPTNRRSLTKLLVEYCAQNVINQLIVTTFEESIIRKYVDDESVKVIAL